jgi:DNA-binding IscR family transcriptional regulator
VVHCALPEDDSCDRVEGCAAHLLWTRLSAVMAEFLDSVTLQDLCDEARQLRGE